ncbi:MAG: DNA-processing protein DprA [Spirochaetota bacterium]
MENTGGTAVADEELTGLLILSLVTNCAPGKKYDLYRELGAGWFRRLDRAERQVGRHLLVNGSRLDAAAAGREVERMLRRCRACGIHPVTVDSPHYPSLLREIPDPPLVLFARGRLELLEAGPAVALVGSRRPSNFSVNLAYSIARDLAGAGVVVVSGLAAGIDGYAHRGALDGGGGTVAVLGNGIDVVYPRSARDLYARVGEEGLLLSEFPLGARPLRHHFPLRNRIISGLARGTVVVEASRRSGALITAQAALDQGREVMALPGRAGSEAFQGNNLLIKQGACLVEDAADIGEVLRVDVAKLSGLEKKLDFSELENNILNVIGDERVSVLDIRRQIPGPVERISSTLTLLELKGAVVQYPGKYYMRASEHG